MITTVRLLTENQKDLLMNQYFDVDSYFSPTLDADNNWFITNEEVEANIYPEFEWIQDLPIINYNPIQIDLDLL